MSRLLYNLVRKNQKWDWVEKQEKRFMKLKEKFTKELILAVLDLDKKMRMEVDMLMLESKTVDLFFVSLLLFKSCLFF